MQINPGELNKKISIYSKTETPDADGYATTEYVMVRACWAKFSRTSGTEAIKAKADFSEIKARFLIRYMPEPITRKMIVRYGGTDYEIVYVNDYDDMHEYIEIWASEVTTDG